MATTPNKYGVHNRLALLENAVTELEAENKRLRVHLAGELKTAVNNAMHVIQDSIRVPVDGAPGRDGRDGESIKGDKGERGDVLYITPEEVTAQVKALRLKLAKWQAAVQFAYEQNYGTKHQGLKRAIEDTLKTVEQRANS